MSSCGRYSLGWQGLNEGRFSRTVNLLYTVEKGKANKT